MRAQNTPDLLVGCLSVKVLLLWCRL